MGWGLDFTADLYLSKQNYNENVHQVQDAIDETLDTINKAKSTILMYTAATPKDVVGEEWESEPLGMINMYIQETFESLDEEYKKLFLLQAYLEYLTEKFDK